MGGGESCTTESMKQVVSSLIELKQIVNEWMARDHVITAAAVQR